MQRLGIAGVHCEALFVCGVRTCARERGSAKNVKRRGRGVGFEKRQGGKKRKGLNTFVDTIDGYVED